MYPLKLDDCNLPPDSPIAAAGFGSTQRFATSGQKMPLEVRLGASAVQQLIGRSPGFGVFPDSLIGNVNQDPDW